MLSIQRLPLLLGLLASLAAAHGPDTPPKQRHGRNIVGMDKSNDVATAMVVDAQGNSYTTGGYSKGKGSGYDYLTIKYDTDGNQIWSERLDGGSSGDDKPVAVRVDSHGSVYVTGSSQGGATDADYLTAKYDSTWKIAVEAKIQRIGQRIRFARRDGRRFQR